MRAGQLAEIEQTAALGSNGKVVFTPTPAQIDSAAFKVIVGDAKYTAQGAPVSTIYDASIGRGHGEIKNGSSVLDSSYQLRLQTYGPLVNDTPLTIYTSRPVNPTFNAWLTRWGVAFNRCRNIEWYDVPANKTPNATCTRADAEKFNRLYLVKNVSNLRSTYQIKMLAFRATSEGLKLVIKVPKVCVYHPSLLDLIKKTGNVILREDY